MHTDLQKCPRCCPQCPHVSPPALLFPDLGHDLKPFLLPKLRVHIVKKLPSPNQGTISQWAQSTPQPFRVECT